ncbi:MAG: 2-oxoglutarate dehydrogenase E1 component [Methyloceanibacter sp.]
MANQDPSTILSPINAAYIGELYARYLRDANAIDASWIAFFADLNDNERSLLSDLSGASWAPRARADGEAAPATGGAAAIADGDLNRAIYASLSAIWLIRSYRVRGHLEAVLDPLGLEGRGEHADLRYQTYGLTEADLDRPLYLAQTMGLDTATLRQVLDILRETYCGHIGVEYMHIQDLDKRKWIELRTETTRNKTSLTEAQKRRTLTRLIEAEEFEKFLDRKYVGTKRFGLEGAESMVAGLTAVVRRAAEIGVVEVVFGMSHRGRLNVLANVLAKPYRAIFSEFQGSSAMPEDVHGSGDVKYHLGTSADREFDGKRVHVSLSANPSHLEAVDPVVLGKVRAKQYLAGDDARAKVMGVIVHGDAAFAGQGMVSETLDLSALKGYETGGTVHFIVNNQIGFTTSPAQSRSSPYCSDKAKGVQAPIFHVNGDDPEAVVHVARMAVDYRDAFKSDVVVDMFCYRRHGHNEADEPAFTQPLMYARIRQHPSVVEVYSSRLVEEGLLTRAEVDRMQADFRAHLEEELAASDAYRPNRADWLDGKWSGIGHAEEGARRGVTGVDLELLREVGRKITSFPKSFTPHKTITRIMAARRKTIDEGQGIDWATAEALAFGTLLVEGYPVRLSGQDSERGTFSQRHAVLMDQVNEKKYTPLKHIAKDQARFEVINSMLSEEAVLGFEYGYSLAEPNALVVWEAQFGDFANGAQVIIDQFISSGERKWLRMSGLVLLLPHGYEGQGPEHSSARLERYLQLCAEDNWQIANCSTPANYFHILRRQLHRQFRKPLVLMTPKSLLRHKRVVSTLAQFGPDSSFHRLLWDDAQFLPDQAIKLVPDDKIRRVVLCSGKVYYDLYEEREKRGLNDVYLVRVEQLYPFPARALIQELGRFKDAEMVWCQEEPKNMGAWSFIEPNLSWVLEHIDAKHKRPHYAGRPSSAATATGLMSKHVRELKAFLDEALG